MFADGLKCREKMGDAEQVADRWAHVVDLEFAAGGFRVNIQAD
jgi:hypothetical protein